MLKAKRTEGQGTERGRTEWQMKKKKRVGGDYRLKGRKELGKAGVSRDRELVRMMLEIRRLKRLKDCYCHFSLSSSSMCLSHIKI